MSKRKTLWLLLRWLFAIAALGYLSQVVPLAQVGQILAHTHYGYLISILLLAEFSLLQQAVRWRRMMEGEDIALPSVGVYFQYTALGSFFNLLLPSGIGGDAVKSVALGRLTQRMGHSMASTLVARILGLLALVILFWMGVPFLVHANLLESRWLWIMSGFALALLVSVVGLVRFSPWLAKFPRFKILLQLSEELARYRHRKSLLVRSFLDSLIIQGLILFSHFLMFQAVGAPISMPVVLVAFPLVTIATLLPISVYGVGIRESMALLLYGHLSGLQNSQILAATLLGYVVVIFQALQGAWFWVNGRRASQRT